MSKLLKLTVVIIAAAASLTLALAPGAAQDLLPEGVGVEVVRDKCLLCHEADLIVQQRLGKPGWTREVDKMIRWGAAVPAAEKDALVDDLAARYPPR